MAKKYDNIDLDVMDADRLGYGVHYGHFKMDHPFTKEKNEDRLKQKEKQSRQKKPSKSIERQVLTRTCPTCKSVFTTKTKTKVYCCKTCKEKRDRKAYRANRAKQ